MRVTVEFRAATNGEQALILVNPQDATEIAGLSGNIDDEALHHRLVENVLICAFYQWSEIAARQERIYASVVPRNGDAKAI